MNFLHEQKEETKLFERTFPLTHSDWISAAGKSSAGKLCSLGFFGQTFLNFPEKRENTRRQKKASCLRADDVILMILLVSWRPPFGRLMYYHLFMRFYVPSPSYLRSHNASVMFCQVRHDGSGEAPGGLEESNSWSQAAFSFCLFLSL